MVILGAVGLLARRRATIHWSMMEVPPAFGAMAVAERIVHDGKVVTGAGVSAGIDMALALAALVAGDDVARAIQTQIAYSPCLPFTHERA